MNTKTVFCQETGESYNDVELIEHFKTSEYESIDDFCLGYSLISEGVNCPTNAGFDYVKELVLRYLNKERS